jgi:hypothetical protein
MNHHEPGELTRNTNDEWPDSVPIGTFDISVNGIEGRPEVSAHILFVCPNGKRCGVLLGPNFADRPAPDQPCVWKWDGNIDRPTITPSINCIAEKDGKPTGGCGWHGYITDGEFR